MYGGAIWQLIYYIHLPFYLIVKQLLWICVWWSHLTADLLYTPPLLSFLYWSSCYEFLYGGAIWQLIYFIHLPFFLFYSEAVFMNFYIGGAIWWLIYTSFLLSFSISLSITFTSLSLLYLVYINHFKAQASHSSKIINA